MKLKLFHFQRPDLKLKLYQRLEGCLMIILMSQIQIQKSHFEIFAQAVMIIMRLNSNAKSVKILYVIFAMVLI